MEVERNLLGLRMDKEFVNKLVESNVMACVLLPSPELFEMLKDTDKMFEHQRNIHEANHDETSQCPCSSKD